MLDEPFEMLPDYISLPPELYPSYVMHRVRNEPEGGNPGLVTIRKVIEHLQDEANPSSQAVMLESLCNLLLEKKSNVFRIPPTGYPGDRYGEFEDHLVIAAVYLGKTDVVKRWLGEKYDGAFPYSWIFGLAVVIAQRHGDMDMINFFLSAARGLQIKAQRKSFFVAACGYGREDIFEEIFNFQIDTIPWPGLSEQELRRTIRNLEYPLVRAFMTPSIKILDYLLDLHKQKLPGRLLRIMLEKCAQHGHVNMFRYILDKGAIPVANTLYKACSYGHFEIVEALLHLNIHHEAALEIAAQKGHGAIVKLLLDHNAWSAGALEKAAYHGRRDIVQLLLDAGMEFDSKESLHLAMENAATLDHDRMMDILLELSMRTWPALD